MNFNNFETLKIGGYDIQKLVRVSDGAVIFEKNPQPKPFFEISYSSNEYAVLVLTLRVGYYGETFEIDWGDGQKQTVSSTEGQIWITNVRHNYQSTSTPFRIRIPQPVSYFIATAGASGILGIYDKGNNIDFRYVKSGPDSYDWRMPNLSTLDISRVTSVPRADYNGFLDDCGLNQIIIPAALESNFRSNAKWNKYSSLFVTK